MKELANINTKKPDLTNITMAGSTFQFNFQVSNNLKLKNLRKKQFLKEKIKSFLIDSYGSNCDFTLERYNLQFVPKSNKNEEETLYEWCKFAQDKNIEPSILIKFDDIDTKKLFQNIKKSFEESLKDLSEKILKDSLLKFEKRHQKYIQDSEKRHQIFMQDLKKKGEENHKKNIQDIKNMFNTDFKASKNIYKLTNYISLFRQKIVNHFNNNNNNNGKNYSDWDNMKKNEHKNSINSAVEFLGMNLNSWVILEDLVDKLDRINHHLTIKIEDALNYIESLSDTDYEQYQEPFKNLIELFKSDYLLIND